ncbi:hypothetical protein EXS54_01605 [Patescibacteria group bacterium]|nr:hypothetical protein [Patescibacteria group bacterium]
MDGSKELTAVIRHVTSDRALLDLNGQTVSWPREALPDDAHEGDTVQLRMVSAKAAEQDRQELARAILSEILGGRQ